MNHIREAEQTEGEKQSAHSRNDSQNPPYPEIDCYQYITLYNIKQLHCVK